MLKFLSSLRGKPAVVIETQRQQFDRVTEELNEMIVQLGGLPAIKIDPAAQTLTLTAPDQFPDEALALPAPTSDEISDEIAAPEVDAAEAADTDTAKA